MNIPEFDKSQILKVIAAIAQKWGTPEEIRELEATLRAVTDCPAYLRLVATQGPRSAENLVQAAVLGISIAYEVRELTKEGYEPFKEDT